MIDIFYDAFVSYNSKDGEIVEKICVELENSTGLRIWKDNWEISGGDLFMDILPDAINKSKCLITFIGRNGEGRYQKEEVSNALRNAIENGNKVIPVFLTEDSFDSVPSFLMNRSRIVFEESRWFIHLLKCAITDMPPGRKDKFILTITQYTKLNLVHWNISDNRLDYILKLRINNESITNSIIVNGIVIRTNKVALHPDKQYVETLFGPITEYYESIPLKIPNSENKTVQHFFNPEQYLKPSEIQDFKFYLKLPIGLQLNVSFQILWQEVGEVSSRILEFGYLLIGQKGEYDDGDPYGEEPSYPNVSSSYKVGQHNLDEPAKVNSMTQMKFK
jgi:hypothetical protein